jgi:translation initiation factor IF-2
MATVTDIGKKYAKSPAEVEAAMRAVGVSDSFSPLATLSADDEMRISAFWKEQSENGGADPIKKPGAQQAHERRSELKVKDSTTGREKSVSVTHHRKRRVVVRPKPAADKLAEEKPAATPAVAEAAEAVKKPPSAPEPLSASPEKKTAQPQAIQAKPAADKPAASPPPEAAKLPTAEEAKKKKEEEEKTKSARPFAPKPAESPRAAAAIAKKRSKADALSFIARVEKESPFEDLESEDETPPPPPPKPGRREATLITISPEAAARRRRARGRLRRAPTEDRPVRHGFVRPEKPVVREIALPETIGVQNLAQQMAVKAGDIIAKLMQMGTMVTINQTLDQETAWIIAEEFGHRPRAIKAEDAEMEAAPAAAADVKPRAPVVTVMGHVDHGKTSLLDYIRETRVAAGEAGGITQHIGAYRAQTDKGEITFLDTPGHELFAEMRARGAKATDIVVLVVAADDGVKRQTIEAINHARAAEVPIIVAANKIDRAGADLEKVKRELSENGVIAEDWGGDAIVVGVSAKTGEGVPALLEAVALQAELLDLKAAASGAARGVVIEARMEKGRGAVASVLVTQGVLSKGDVILCGAEWGRARALWDERGKMIKSAAPSEAAEIQGLSGLPEVGVEFAVVADERKAREIALYRQGKNRAVRLTDQARKPSAMAALNADGVAETAEVQTLRLIIKADVQGSREALAQALSRLAAEGVEVKILHSGVGAITETDVNLARASGALIVAFNVRADAKAKRLMESRGVTARYHSVVYDAVDDVKRALSEMLEPLAEETVIGAAEVKEVFRISKVGNIAGCLVTEGAMRAGAPARLLRDGAVVYTGEISTLRHFKDAVGEVRAGSECGVGLRRFNDIKAGDKIEALEITEKEREI